MQLPKRKSQQDRQALEVEGPEYLTATGIENLKKTLVRLEKDERPKIVVDLQFGLSLGDFSENAEYQDAKMRLSRIDGRIFGIKERLKRAITIGDGGTDGKIRLGSHVVVSVNGKQKDYHIVGPRESDPSKGRISHVSPLGDALLGKTASETVTIQTANGPVMYGVVSVE
ncbi:MAG: transcription elongation factor GreA [Patescibacteria group bacterium]